MAGGDYYDILGISKTATDTEIKKGGWSDELNDIGACMHTAVASLRDVSQELQRHRSSPTDNLGCFRTDCSVSQVGDEVAP